MQINEIIAAVQEKLGIHVDGRAGPHTWAAIYSAIVKEEPGAVPTVRVIDPADARSEKFIAALLPQVRPIARALVQKAGHNAIQIKVISGLRTEAEQEALYAQGRTTPGEIVTNTRAGHSHHNFGIAFDVGVFEGARYMAESAKYKAVGALGMELGLQWGGSWKTLVDQSHFLLCPAWAMDMTERDMLAQLRERVDSGRPIYS